MTGNDFVKFFLHTPFHIFLGNTMLITVTGRKTGKKYPTPVGYYHENGTLWVISNRNRTWWRNVMNSAKVTLLMKGKTISAFAETVMDEKDVEKQLMDYVRHLPMSARGMGIHIENGRANVDDIARVAKDRLFVKIKTFT